jgi:2-oxoisovalerate dehydrogenase E1 component
MHDDEPTLLLIPKHIMRVRHGPLTGAQRPFGCARVVREGQDVTIVTWGNCVELAQRVAGQRAHRLSVEILDLVSLVPCDWTAVEQSVAKTGRLVVICEDNRTASFGQSVIAEMVSSQRRFDLLLSPPTLVARENCHIPFHPALEYDVLPDEARVHEALTQVMR